jgi:hypothetical protein
VCGFVSFPELNWVEVCGGGIGRPPGEERRSSLNVSFSPKWTSLL